MHILWVKKDYGSGLLTWRISDGNMTRHRTSLRKVTNRKLKKSLWSNGKTIKAY